MMIAMRTKQKERVCYTISTHYSSTCVGGIQKGRTTFSVSILQERLGDKEIWYMPWYTPILSRYINLWIPRDCTYTRETVDVLFATFDRIHKHNAAHTISCILVHSIESTTTLLLTAGFPLCFSSTIVRISMIYSCILQFLWLL